MEYDGFIKAADSLLFSQEFEELRQKIEFKEPNLWHILGISRRENLVSNFLAWLLDPNSNHSLGESFLKELIITALRKGTGQPNNLTPVHVKLWGLFRLSCQNRNLAQQSKMRYFDRI